MISAADLYNAEIRQCVTNPQTPIRETLKKPQIVLSFQTDMPNVRSYFCLHAKELLNLVFSDSKDSVCTRAFQIISMNSIELMSAILRDDIFRDAATDMLVQPEVPQYLLGRLSAIIYAAMLALPEPATEACGFIYRLLPHCSNPSVFNFFESITMSDDRLLIVHHWLKGMGFSEYINRELGRIDFKHVSTLSNPFFDPVYFHAFALLKIIGDCAMNSIILSSFCNEDTIKSLALSFPDPPPFFTNARWFAIQKLTNENTSKWMKSFIPDAIKVLEEQFTKLHEYRISALRFLALMLQYEPSTFDTLLDSSLLQILVGILLQFPNSSIFHGEFRYFVTVSLKNRTFAEMMIRLYSPILIGVTKENENHVLIPTCFDIMAKFARIALNDPELKIALTEGTEFQSFAQDMKSYEKMCDSSYGGERPGAFLKAFKALFD